MVTKAQEEHELVVEMLQDPETINQIERNHLYMKMKMKKTIDFFEETYRVGNDRATKVINRINAARPVPDAMFKLLESTRDKRAYRYLKWINKETNYNHYLLEANKIDGSSVGMCTRTLDAFVLLDLCQGNKSVTKVLGGPTVVLDIMSLHSLKKGAGYKMMKNILSFAARHELIVTLWTETEANVRYFERYGFVNHGRLGDDHEYLMMLKG